VQRGSSAFSANQTWYEVETNRSRILKGGTIKPCCPNNSVVPERLEMHIRQGHLYKFRGLMFVAIGFIGLASLAMGYTVWKLRSDAIEDAYKDTTNIAAVLAVQTAQAVRSIDLVISDVQDRILSNGVTTSDDLRRVMATEYGHALLKNRLDRLPEADGVFVTDADGHSLSSSRAWPGPQLDLADRDYFKHFKHSQEKNVYVSFPAPNRVTGLPSVFFAKPIRGADGVFLGVVAIGTPIAQFRHIYATVDLLGDYGFMLSRADGTIVVRYPEERSLMGQKAPASSPWYALVAQGGGQFRSNGIFVSGPRLVSVHPVPTYPLVVSVGIIENTALAVWRQRSAFIAIGTVLALICSFFLLWAVSNRVRLLKKSEMSLAEQKEILAAKSHELEEAKARTDAAIENVQQGISMFDAAQRLVICNQRYLEIYGLSPDVIKPGCTFQEIMVEYQKTLGKNIGKPGEYLAENIAQVLQGKKFSHTATLTNGRIIASASSPTPDGGWIATHEDITERHRADALIAHMARHDALTSLPNRVVYEQKFDEALSRLKRHGEPFAVLMFDLDRFKVVNDTLGHPAGDKLLKAVAQRVLPCVRELDAIARLGGDEFAILQTHLGDPELDARLLANRLLDAMGAPFMIDDHQLQVGLSIGVALAPKDGADMERLEKNADLALYRAKKEGRNRLRFFDPTLDAGTASTRDMRVA
jgi:diguanylate cyclase (GGDEF)-like protein